MEAAEREDVDMGIWAKPEFCCVICILQVLAMYFVWEAAREFLCTVAAIPTLVMTLTRRFWQCVAGVPLMSAS